MPTEIAPALEMRSVGKQYPGVKALDDVSLEVRPGEVLALMGENGAGKSTLMKILAGAIPADSGQILVDGKPVTIHTPQDALNLGISIIYQEFNLVPHLSVAENIYLGREPRLLPGWVDWGRMRRDARAVLHDLGLDLDVDTPILRLSVAQMQMVEIAKATSRKTRVVAMDEPSATLTEHELTALFRLIRRLRESGVAIIYISHRMEEVFAIADRVTVLRDGRSVGSRDIGAVNQAELIRLMVGREVGVTARLAAPSSEAAPGEPLLSVRGLGRRGALSDISFEVWPGEIVGLAGLVGSGRTEVARCLFGADRFDQGEMRLGGKPYHPSSPREAIRRGVALVTEDRKQQGLMLTRTVRENGTLPALDKVSSLGFISPARERSAVSGYVQSLRVRTPSIEQTVGNLSGGNQQKVVLAKWLLTGSRLLIMDEPTRGIDIGAKSEIYDQMRTLAADGVAILMISSELPEVLALADRILVMRGGRLVGELPGAEATAEKVGQLALGASAA